MGELFKWDIMGLCITDTEPTYNFEHKLYHKMGNEASIRENEILVWKLAKCSKTPQDFECNNFLTAELQQFTCILIELFETQFRLSLTFNDFCRMRNIRVLCITYSLRCERSTTTTPIQKGQWVYCKPAWGLQMAPDVSMCHTQQFYGWKIDYKRLGLPGPPFTNTV